MVWFYVYVYIDGVIYRLYGSDVFMNQNVLTSYYDRCRCHKWNHVLFTCGVASYRYNMYVWYYGVMAFILRPECISLMFVLSLSPPLTPIPLLSLIPLAYSPRPYLLL